MDNEKTNDDGATGKKADKALEYQIDQLKDSMGTISSELETIKLNIQKRKSENTTLKILFYTGLIVLLLGFLYTNSTLQRAQMASLESSIHTLQTLMKRELMSVEKNVYNQIDQLAINAENRTKSDLQVGLENMSLALSRLNPDDPKTAELVDQVKRHSMELGQAYAEHQKSLQSEPGDGESPDHFEKKIFGQN
ncbi:MAG: hypothetical protein NPINA01_06450 [Nitrospinaceae bacterium]|nr:MAG: hypothetical protein NPINA01_06450 [Nitrospinaceae bacterium]